MHRWKIHPSSLDRVESNPFEELAGEVDPVFDDPVLSPESVNGSGLNQRPETPVQGSDRRVVRPGAADQTAD